MIYTICWIEFVYWQHHYIFIIQLKKNQLRVLTGVSMMTNIARHPMTIKLYDIEGLWWVTRQLSTRKIKNEVFKSVLSITFVICFRMYLIQ